MKESIQQTKQLARIMQKSGRNQSVNFEDNRKEGVSQIANKNSICQFAIEDCDNLDDFIRMYNERDDDVLDERYYPHVLDVLSQGKVYNYDEAWDEIFRLMAQMQKVKIKLSTLIPRLDSTQHQLGNLKYEDGVITQDGTVYKKNSLDYILEHHEQIKPIWFETVVRDAEIVTGDGRHRIAVYSVGNRIY